jgi:hypothetical protein
MVVIHRQSPHCYNFTFEHPFHRNLSSISAPTVLWLLLDIRSEAIEEILEISVAIFENEPNLPVLYWDNLHLDRPILIFRGDDLNDIYTSLWDRLDEFTTFSPPLTPEQLHHFEDQERVYEYTVGSWLEEYVVPELPDVWPGLAEEQN